MAPILYAGLEVLALPPDVIDGASRRERAAVGADSWATPWGTPVHRLTGAPLAASHELVWCAKSRAELAALEAFFARRAGRRTAFWLPTFREDLDVLVAPGDQTWTVAGWGYAARVSAAFTALAVRDHVIGFVPDGAPDGRWIVQRIDDATDNGDGTETLTFAPTLAASSAGSVADLLTRTTATGLTASLLRCARLADDSVTIEYLHGELALVRARAVDLPRETPVSV